MHLLIYIVGLLVVGYFALCLGLVLLTSRAFWVCVLFAAVGLVLAGSCATDRTRTVQELNYRPPVEPHPGRAELDRRYEDFKRRHPD